MITQDVSFEGFTATDWQRLADVFRAPGQAGVEVASATRGGVVAVTAGNRLRKLVHTRRGRLDVRGSEWPLKLPALAGRYDASWAVELSSGALEDLVERFSERLRPGQQYLEQALLLARALRELEAEGRIFNYDIGDYNGGKCVFRPKGLDAGILEASYWKLYDSLYTFGAIARRMRGVPQDTDLSLRSFIMATNLHYRAHVRRRITPGIV